MILDHERSLQVVEDKLYSLRQEEYAQEEDLKIMAFEERELNREENRLT